MPAALINHAFVSAKSDGPDTTFVRPSNWNANLKVTGGASGQKLIRDAAAADGASFIDSETISFVNNSGASVAAGDVLAVGSGGAVVDDTAGAIRKFIVALATIANSASGPWAKSGYITAVKAQGSVPALHYVQKSATSKAVEDTGVAVGVGNAVPVGAIGISTATDAGGFVALLLFDQTAGAPLTPTGTIAMFGGSSSPSGWHICDGSPISRSTFAALFGVIGTTFGIGDGSTTFNLPDLRGRAPFGKAAAGTFTTLGGSGGTESLPSHQHTNAALGGPNNTDVLGSTTGDASIPTNAHSHSISNTGNPITSPSIVNPFLVVNFIIKD